MRSHLFGISRHHGGQNVVVAGHRFVDGLSRALGVPFELHMAEDYEHLHEAVRARQVALAWMPPFVALRVPAEEGTLVAVSELPGAHGPAIGLLEQRRLEPLHGADHR